eukprot:TRINITY_DN21953_c0_g2_i1.p1 TRINITY_DN21953_c0_g2~~TRINITY_DN21953_c0_g2_i1.p1  ORF type:complete len:707 (+),score=168.42 TRINITY_DN21953_c0_g2_i1:142-2121(+)
MPYIPGNHFHGGGSGGSAIEAEYFIEQRLVGWVMGKKGAALKDVESKFSVQLTMDQNSKDQGYSTLKVAGGSSAVQSAAEHINNSLARASGDNERGPFLLDKPPRSGGAFGGGHRGGAPDRGGGHGGHHDQEEVQIEQKYVGWLVGKSGGAVQKMEAESGCKISINQDTRSRGYSVAILVGSPHERRNARRIIEESIFKAMDHAGELPRRASEKLVPLSNPRQAVSAGEELTVEQKYVGYLLGQKGGLCREVEQDTGASIKIDQATRNQGFSVVRFTGDRRAVKMAQERILGAIEKASGAPSAQQQRPIESSVRSAPYTSGGSTGSRAPAFAGGGGGGYGRAGGMVPAAAQPAMTEGQVQVEQRLVGWLLGTKGSCIKDLEEISGAQLSMNQDTKDQGFSVVYIKGDAVQVRRAQELIQDKIQQADGETSATEGRAEPIDPPLLAAVDFLATATGKPELAGMIESLLREHGCTRLASADAQAGYKTMEVQVEQKFIGWLLGTKGKTLREIEEATGAKITVDQGCKDLGYSLFKMSGPGNSTYMAKQRLEASVDKVEPGMGATALTVVSEAGADDAVEGEVSELQVEQRLVGWVLGRGGTVMKELERHSGAKITIDQSTKDMGFSTIRITGPSHLIQRARELLEEKVKQADNAVHNGGSR